MKIMSREEAYVKWKKKKYKLFKLYVQWHLGKSAKKGYTSYTWQGKIPFLDYLGFQPFAHDELLLNDLRKDLDMKVIFKTPYESLLYSRPRIFCFDWSRED